ncbi:thiamine biosynthesis protein ThiS [Flexistipes sinusarabici DSM 4947]|uniref:Thiamine biosynthesis protein ThiS n=1 Tax=Flexistipes sinusarabici (strain ATCC 49648 / DSM 4947 / MAS 10) TaxID=717231 RepID=F8E9S5_FLESM|nr:sulfur carrier protein ThiS [Flexistipes sinusarabici]AEI14258.1 thiamine biosynthesis protein ThiS [Flexistipes sinusarabici DSM 4947]
MKLFVNDEEKHIEKDALLLLDLLLESGVENPDTVVVQLNGEFVEKNSYQKTYVKENDKVDFLYFVGGGIYERFNY